MIKVLPHPKVEVNEWDIDGCPASIIVSLSNNTKEEYVRKIAQPEPQFKKVMDLIEKLPVYGPSAAGYKGRHAKK